MRGRDATGHPRPIVVIGGGAAGLMAAWHAASRGAPVDLCETTADGGRKILISGGGRCNVLPAVARPRDYVTDSSPRAMQRLLRAWPLAEQRRFFEEELGVPLALEVESAKLFPVSNRARDVRDALVAGARRQGVRFHFSTRVTAVRPPEGARRHWMVEEAGGGRLEASRVILATGGLSVPATGSDGAGLRWVEALGHTVHAPYPALTPLLGDPAHAALAGVSLEVTVRVPEARPRFTTRGGFLFTHRGYSGPAVLDVSHHAIVSAREGAPRRIAVQWTDLDAAGWEERLLEADAGSVKSVLAERLPERLVRLLMDEAGVPHDRAVARLRREERRALTLALADWTLPWHGDEGYRKAEVTGGGVALDQVDLATLESRVTPGLHLCGEILDAFGPIGGHNFSWAWATGRTAGLAAAHHLASERGERVE